MISNFVFRIANLTKIVEIVKTDTIVNCIISAIIAYLQKFRGSYLPVVWREACCVSRAALCVWRPLTTFEMLISIAKSKIWIEIALAYSVERA